MDLRTLVRKIPDYPTPGTTYYDITTLMWNAEGLHALVDELAARYASRGVRKFACMEWRGFVIGSAVAYRLGAGFVPIRRLGKLTGLTRTRSYEYGHASEPLEMSVDAIASGETVVLVDDMLATGTVTEAAAMLVKDVGGKILECCFVHELAALGGRRRLEKQGLSVFALWEN